MCSCGYVKTIVNNIISFLFKCSKCNGSGKIFDLGCSEIDCTDCKMNRNIFYFLNKQKDWILKNTAIFMTCLIFIVMLFITYYHPDQGSFSVLVASFGFIFVALKYKIDQVSYHKSLFDKRYAIFLKIQEIVFNNDANGKWQDAKEKFDFIYRESYFLFSKKTYSFIIECQLQILNMLILNQEDKEDKKVIKAKHFFTNLQDGQKLSEKFPELKIDLY